MKNKKILSLILSTTILLGVNIYYILTNIPPDGRWIFEIPITSFFIFIYVALFFMLGDRIVKKPNNVFYYYMVIFNTMVAIFFLIFSMKLVKLFQDIRFAHYDFISIAPYVIILGSGIIVYTILNLSLKKKVLTE